MYQITKAKKLADKIYLMDVVAPRVAANCLPGQFIIAKVDKEGERIPLTICDYDREKGTITIVFQIVGASTEKMSKLVAGDSFTDFVGPLGVASEFTKEDPEALKNKKFLFVAGGVGAAPVYPQVKWLQCNDINQSLMSSLLELFTGIFVLVSSSKNCNYFLLSRKRYRSAHL